MIKEQIWYIHESQDLHSLLSRVRAQSASRLSFKPRAPASAPVHRDPPARSFVPSLTRRDSTRSLLQPRFGSRLHARSTAPAPTARPSFIRHAIIEERRLASNKLTARSGGLRKNKPVKSVRFEETVTIHPVTRWINAPTKSVSFGSTTVIPPAPWEINKPAKNVSFGSRKAAIPVTRYINPKKHVSAPRFGRPRVQATHARSTAQVGTGTGDVSARLKAPAKSGCKAKPAKHVHFGETTAHNVTRWIDPVLHVSRLPSRARKNRLQGWSVTPFSKPDKFGEEARYIATWGTGTHAMLTKHASKPCDHGQACSYNVLAGIQARHPAWAPKMVFKSWLHKREAVRQMGYPMF
ncbi:hypothetical protein BJY01DRAFT_258524 [Aspergillus pseudoustus]|uniref:Uncharacterized protein n=1 Tax=Aspergillus pseudoustus TaxID=1810923 RepID=A0ABR4JAD6_9EURO